MRTPHTAVRKNKRVLVKMRDGIMFIDKFMDRDSRHVYFEGRTVPRSQIESFKIVKGNPTLRHD